MVCVRDVSLHVCAIQGQKSLRLNERRSFDRDDVLRTSITLDRIDQRCAFTLGHKVREQDIALLAEERSGGLGHAIRHHFSAPRVSCDRVRKFGRTKAHTGRWLKPNAMTTKA